MRGYTLPLNENETTRLYWELSRKGAYCSGEKKSWSLRSLSLHDLVVLSLLQCRYDPRLTAILVEWLPRVVLRLNPVSLKSELRRYGALPTVAVIGDFAMQSGTKPSEEVCEFFLFLQTGVKPVSLQLFYRGIYTIAGRKMDEALSTCLWHFKKWGFLATDLPLMKGRLSNKRIYRYDQGVRLQQLQWLARERKNFRLQDYLDLVHFSISRQQALKDLQSLPQIHKSGIGKGSRYHAI